MKQKISIAFLLTVGIVIGIVLFFEQHDQQTENVFEKELVWEQTESVTQSQEGSVTAWQLYM